MWPFALQGLLHSEVFLKKIAFLFFPVLSFGISTTLLQILNSLRFISTHQKASIGRLERGCLNFRKHTSTGVLKKTAPKIPAYFPTKHPRWSTLAGLPRTIPKSCLLQLFCRESFSACFCKKELGSRRNFSDFSAF